MGGKNTPRVTLCSSCGIQSDRKGQRCCRKCHAEYMSIWRMGTDLTQEQRYKDNCRSYANVYKRHGHLIQEDCQVCGDPNSEMHHPDYDKPLEVEWMCRDCHLELHYGARVFRD